MEFVIVSFILTNSYFIFW